VKKIKDMETLLVINSILVAICLYFIKDFHSDFKEVAKKVERLENKLHSLSSKIKARISFFRKAE